MTMRLCIPVAFLLVVGCSDVPHGPAMDANSTDSSPNARSGSSSRPFEPDSQTSLIADSDQTMANAKLTSLSINVPGMT